MPRESRHWQNAMNTGELSPRLYSRWDLAKYAHGLKTLENFVPLVYGGVKRRAGSRFVARAKPLSPSAVTVTRFPTSNEIVTVGWTNPNNAHADDGVYATAAPNFATHDTRWFNFGFDVNIPANAIILSVRVLCEYKVSATTADSRVIVRGVISGTALAVLSDNSEPTVDTVVTYDMTSQRPWIRADLLDANFKVQVGAQQNDPVLTPTFSLDAVRVEVIYDTTPNVPRTVRLLPFEFSTTQAYTLEAGELYLRFFTNNGRLQSGTSGQDTGTAIEIATPYASTDLADIQFAQSADVLYLTHQNHHPRKLQRLSATSFTLTTVPFVDGPYLDENTTTTQTLTLTGGPPWTNGSTLTLTAVGHTPFQSAHATAPGALWRLKVGSDTAWVQTTGFTSSTVVTVTAKKDVPAALQGVATSFWREGLWSAVRGYPRAVTFFEDRAVYGGAAIKPQRFDGSGVATYEDSTPGTADDDAYAFAVTSGRVNQIEWMLGARQLLIGTAGEEFSARGAPGKTITPTSIEVRSETVHGSPHRMPVRVGNSTLFIQRSFAKLRELVFDADTEGYFSVDATLLAEHLTESTDLLELAYQQEPRSTVWGVRSDGVLLGLAYDKTQDVAGWSRHITDGLVKSIAVIPHPDGDRDQLWLAVERTIGGAKWHYVEYLDEVGGHFAAYKQLGVDSGLNYSGAATATLSGLAHLEGKSVAIVGNGAVYPNQTVMAGQVTGLSPTVTAAEVGLAFTSKLETLTPVPPVAPDAPKRRARLFVRLDNSLGLKIQNEQVAFRKAGDPMGQPPPIFTGEKGAVVLGWDKDATMTILQEQPLPCLVTALYGPIDVGD